MGDPDLGDLEPGDEVNVRFVCRYCEDVEWDVWVTAVENGDTVSLNASTPGGTRCPECLNTGKLASS